MIKTCPEIAVYRVFSGHWRSLCSAVYTKLMMMVSIISYFLFDYLYGIPTAQISFGKSYTSTLSSA